MLAISAHYPLNHQTHSPYLSPLHVCTPVEIMDVDNTLSPQLPISWQLVWLGSKRVDFLMVVYRWGAAEAAPTLWSRYQLLHCDLQQVYRRGKCPNAGAVLL